MKKIKKFRVTIRERQVLTLLKYRDGVTEDAAMYQRMVAEEIQSAYPYLCPASIYDTYKLDNLPFAINESVSLKELLRNALCVSCFAVTIGNGVEQQIETLQANGDIAKAAIWDAIGSEAVEQAANFVNRLIREEAALETHGLTTRFSPGYGDVNITANIELLRLLGAEKIGITANDAGMLVPQKSITALIGWEKIKKTKK